MTEPRPLRPPTLVELIVDSGVRCWRCDKLLIELAARPWRVICPRCKACNQSEPPAPPPLRSEP